MASLPTDPRARQLEAILRRLLPDASVRAAGPGDEVAASPAPPDVGGGRRRRFERGRSCAAAALADLAAPGTDVGRGEQREPLWPSGFVGSISHAGDLSAAAVALRSRLETVGIDVATHEPLPNGVADLVITDASAEFAAVESADPAVVWATVLFSAKESIYKAWYPVVGAWLDFHDVVVELAADEPTIGSFSVRPSGRVPMAAGAAHLVAELRGRFELDPDAELVVTSVVRPA